MEKVIATIEKNAVEELRIELSEYRGHDLVNLRIWAAYDAPTSEKRPTKKGFALRITQLPSLIAALLEAEREARAAGLIEDPAGPAQGDVGTEQTILAAG